MTLLDTEPTWTCGRKRHADLASGFRKGSQCGREASLTLWMGPFQPIQCAIVAASVS